MNALSFGLVLAFSIIGVVVFGQAPLLQNDSITFRKRMIAAESFESVDVFDVNNDKVLDLVSGAFWYEGPDFVKRHVITQPTRFGEYYNDYSTIPMDVDGDGWTDFITGGWDDKEIYWRKNPEGYDREWKNQTIGKTGNVETTRAWDIDGDGIREVVPNNPGNPLKIFRLLTDASGKGTGKFSEHVIWSTQGHGLGFGDINKDGQGDLIIAGGWLESPSNPFSGKWKFHEEFNLQKASIPILVTDVNGDGTNDFIAGQGHDYGLSWYEQRIDASGNRSWYVHHIDPAGSQYHTMDWTDLDNDGKNELITGKRYRAHNDNDPGAADPIGLYYFKWNGKSFVKNIISYGVLGEGKGTGNYFAVADINSDLWKDIIVAGKDGLFVFYNMGSSSTRQRK
jgi:hypothetical protein